MSSNAPFLVAAAYRFEQLNENTLSPTEEHEIIACGFQDISASDLIQKLINFILEESSSRSSAYWALGKAHQRLLIPFFVDRLFAEISKDFDSVYQIMIALDNLGERIFSADRTGYSFTEIDLNERDARNYLKEKTEQGAAANP
jgi:hypothetical protein